ncbi:MAG TPA: MFS transporter, partial [Candidatus Paceibacterota bacterium]|nr:MFS transporter [Candidatus Paceibacterota bacterium]
MHASPADQSAPSQSIFANVTFYHWMVVIIASCGWLFDCMDQRLFTMARESTLKELLGNNPAGLANLETYLGLATAAMMVGWATGGIVFGMLSDKWGRVKTMVVTLMVYSGFTGLCGMAQSWLDFTFYRFLVGLGVGGMFGAATTLVAESVPGRFRAVALGSLQALSATGNLLGAYISLKIPPGAEQFFGSFSGWRVLFFVGIIPSLLVIPIITILKEPEAWKRCQEWDNIFSFY